MNFDLVFTEVADEEFAKLENNKSNHKRFNAVKKALALLENNPKHPGLNSHKYHSIKGYNGEEIFEIYAENNTPRAYRIFYHYGPKKNMITIIAITLHP